MQSKQSLLLLRREEEEEMNRLKEFKNLESDNLKKQAWKTLINKENEKALLSVWINEDDICKFYVELKKQNKQGRLVNLCSFLLRFIGEYQQGWCAFLQLLSAAVTDTSKQGFINNVVNLLLIKSPKLLLPENYEIWIDQTFPVILRVIRKCVESLGINHCLENDLLLSPILEQEPKLSDLPINIYNLFASNIGGHEEKYDFNSILIPFSIFPSPPTTIEKRDFWRNMNEAEDNNIITKELEVTVKSSLCLANKSPLTITPIIEFFPGSYVTLDSHLFHYPESREIQEFEAFNVVFENCPKSELEKILDNSVISKDFSFKPLTFINIPQLSADYDISIKLRMKVWETNTKEICAMNLLLTYLEA
ncbi:MAG: hypothetical protein EOO84_22570, partial [Pantoea sp.]|uniref:hypothetical protein n=1 Tax=Pantoea sp. TaxID=69393 RepID=UPI00121D8B90